MPNLELPISDPTESQLDALGLSKFVAEPDMKDGDDNKCLRSSAPVWTGTTRFWLRRKKRSRNNLENCPIKLVTGRRSATSCSTITDISCSNSSGKSGAPAMGTILLQTGHRLLLGNSQGSIHLIWNTLKPNSNNDHGNLIRLKQIKQILFHTKN